MMFRKILDALSLTAIRQRLDRRQLQQELDYHRLFLLTTYYQRHVLQSVANSSDLEKDLAQELDQEAQQLGLSGTRPAVQANLSEQLENICSTLHRVLIDAHDGLALQHQQRVVNDENKQLNRINTSKPAVAGIGRSFRTADKTIENTGDAASVENIAHSSVDEKKVLTLAEISKAFLESYGFTLRVGPSACTHPDAGNGVWLEGRALPGQVVALYPGVAYPPLYHRNIPGYPLVARTNSYLFARFDGTVLDGKPWGLGKHNNKQDLIPRIEDGNSLDSSGVWPITQQNSAEIALSKLEGRNPMAFGHIANHPPRDVLPNVMLAAVDFEISLQNKDAAASLRPYFPVSLYTADDSGMTSKDDKEQNPDDSRRRKDVGNNDTVVIPGAVLISLRETHDEELYLNYRLNPNAASSGLPDWYWSVDPEEDARRWS